MISSEDTRAIHEYFNEQVRIEGLEIPYTMSNHFAWETWLFNKFTKDDLALVIRYMRYRIRMGKREKESLLLRNLISNPDEFSENLSMARSWSRAPKGHTDKSGVLKASGRPRAAQEQPAAVSAKTVLERPKLAEMLKQWSADNL